MRQVTEVVVGAEDEVDGTGLVDFQDGGGAFTTADGAAGDLADDLAVVEGADHTLTGKASALGVGFKRADQKDQDGNEEGMYLFMANGEWGEQFNTPNLPRHFRGSVALRQRDEMTFVSGPSGQNADLANAATALRRGGCTSRWSSG